MSDMTCQVSRNIPPIVSEDDHHPFISGAFEAKKMIKEFQTQDDMYVMKMLKQRQRKELKVPVRSKSSQLATRDPNRLLKPTKQWINRVHDDNVYDTGVGTSLKTLPKLGVPQWRKQL